MVKKSIKAGLSFGMTSGVITTLGLIVGLNSGTHLKLAIIGGVFVIAIADALSDALGMHLSKESEKYNRKEIWRATTATFFSKLIIALTFIIPILSLELTNAIIASIGWGVFLLTILSYKIAKSRGTSIRKAISEHLIIATLVIILSYLVGEFVAKFFGSL